MTVTDTADQLTELPDDETLAATVTALEEHGFSVEVVDTLAAPRAAVLARIPAGSSAPLRVRAERDVRAGLRDPGPGDEGHRRAARLRPRQRPRGDPGRDPGHRLGVRQPARLVRLGGRARHLRHRRPEARPGPGHRPPPPQPAQP